MLWTYGPKTVMGHLASKANGRKRVSAGGRSRFIKSEAARDFASTFPLQLKPPTRPFDGPVAMYAWVYYRDERRDLDIALLQDCIQNAGIIVNDRQIKEIHAKRFVSKSAPKVVFELREIPPASLLDRFMAWVDWVEELHLTLWGA